MAGIFANFMYSAPLVGLSKSPGEEDIGLISLGLPRIVARLAQSMPGNGWKGIPLKIPWSWPGIGSSCAGRDWMQGKIEE